VHVSVVRVWETFLITAAGQDVTVWNIDEEKIVYRRTSTYNITSLFPCHGMFAVGDMTGGLRSYSLDTGEDIFHVEGGANGGGWSSVMTICATDILRSNWANSKSVLFVGTDDGLIRSFDLFTGAFLRFFCGHRRSVSCVDTTTQIWGTSEPALISGSADGTIRIWKSSSAECVHTIVINSLESGIRPRVHSIFVHGRSICCGTDHSVTIWEILPKLKVGRRSAVAGEDQVDQVLVSCESKQINEFALHQRPIRWLQVVGRVVVTCSGDYVLRFWDQDSGDCIRNVHATSGAAFLSFHLTGKLYTSCLFDTSVQVTEFLPINSKRSSSAILG
jgi:WD40 repeat protein